MSIDVSKIKRPPQPDCFCNMKENNYFNKFIAFCLFLLFCFVTYSYHKIIQKENYLKEESFKIVKEKCEKNLDFDLICKVF
jgi:hypothetical protein